LNCGIGIDGQPLEAIQWWHHYYQVAIAAMPYIIVSDEKASCIQKMKSNASAVAAWWHINLEHCW